MGKQPIGFGAHFDVKPLIPNNRQDKFSNPPKKKKFRLKLRYSAKSEHKVKIEKKQSYHDHWELKPMFFVKEEPQIFIKKEPAHMPPLKYKPQKLLPRQEERLATPWGLPDEPDFTDPTYTPLSDEFSVPSSDDESAYFRTNDVLRIQPVNTRKVKVKKEKKRKKTKKPRRRYKRKVLTDSEKLQASRRRRTCLVKKPKSQYLGVSWCNTKNTWVARVWHPTERKLIWAGYHANERACALAVNSKCLDLKIPLKNPHIVGH